MNDHLTSTTLRVIVSSRSGPVNPQTVIGFRLERSAVVSLRVHDLAGRLVRDLVAGVRLAAGGEVDSGRLTLVR